LAQRTIEVQAVSVVLATQAMHRPNEVGTFSWHQCEGRTMAEAADLIVAESEVGPQQAFADLEAFVSELVAKRMQEVE
jgi:hypothetical protein